MPLVLRPITGDLECDAVADFAYMDELAITLNVNPWQCTFGGTNFISDYNSKTLDESIKWIIRSAENREIDRIAIITPEDTNLLQFSHTLGEVVITHDWEDSPLREILVYSFRQIDFETVNGYFQGYWHI